MLQIGLVDVEDGRIKSLISESSIYIYHEIDLYDVDYVNLVGRLNAVIYVSPALYQLKPEPISSVRLKRTDLGTRIKYTVLPKSEKLVGSIYLIEDLKGMKYNINL